MTDSVAHQIVQGAYCAIATLTLVPGPYLVTGPYHMLPKVMTGDFISDP